MNFITNFLTGKGIPDGIGATTKRAISNVYAQNPNQPMYTVADIMGKGLQALMSAVNIHVHSEDDIERITKELPSKLFPCPHTFKVHHVGIERRGCISSMYYKYQSTDEKRFPFDVTKNPITRKKLDYTTQKITCDDEGELFFAYFIQF